MWSSHKLDIKISLPQQRIKVIHGDDGGCILKGWKSGSS
jgi:hypothetical protein